VYVYVYEYMNMNIYRVVRMFCLFLMQVLLVAV
jgi:hypothetical protein